MTPQRDANGRFIAGSGSGSGGSGRRSVRIELNDAGIKALLRSAEVGDEIKRRADNIARAAGPGMHSETYQGRDRVRARVWTGTYAARKAEAEDRALTRALDAGRE